MPMNKRTESIRLKHLQDIYYEKLQGIAYDVYDEQLNPEKPDVPLNKNDAFQKVQKRRVQEKR